MARLPSRDKLIRILAAQKRRELRRKWLSPRMSASQRIGVERSIRQKARKYVAAFKERRVIHVDKECWLRNVRPSKILEYYLPDRDKNWVLPHKREASSESIELEGFSIHDNPDYVFDFFLRLAKFEAEKSSINIHFDDEYCNDIVPYLILAEVRPSLLPILNGGRMSRRIQKVILALKLNDPLRMAFPRHSLLTDVWALPLRQRYPRNTSNSPLRYENPTRAEHVADDLCEELDKWVTVAEPTLELSKQGRGTIKMMVGELLDNAERHSAPDTKDGDWSMAAFMGRRNDGAGRSYFRCHIGFLSVGSTFAESMKSASAPIAQQSADYVRRAKAGGAQTSRETLETLVALQDGMTRDIEAYKGRRGGTGLLEVLDFVSALGLTADPELQPRVTIVSGKSCIALRAPYIQGERMGGPEAPRELWCNEKNSPDLAPDGGFVYDLKHGFPGTVISIAFTLDPDFLTGVGSNGPQA